ncbi:MAG: hypothetical protein LBM04_06070 [Opitutaceae bacterium]|nr:hypothetical protein [Opitutaceae bacterium]
MKKITGAGASGSPGGYGRIRLGCLIRPICLICLIGPIGPISPIGPVGQIGQIGRIFPCLPPTIFSVMKNSEKKPCAPLFRPLFSRTSHRATWNKSLDKSPGFESCQYPQPLENELETTE